MSHPTNQNGRPPASDQSDRDAAPEEDGQPESPTKLTKPSWKYTPAKPCGNSATTSAQTLPPR